MRKLLLIILAFTNYSINAKIIFLGSEYGIKSVTDASISGILNNKTEYDVFKNSGTFIIDRDFILQDKLGKSFDTIQINNNSINYWKYIDDWNQY